MISRSVIHGLGVLVSLAAPVIFSVGARAQGVITTVAGTTWVFRGDGGPAVGAPLGAIHGVAVDTAGNVYLTERVTFLVFKVSNTGIVTVVAGNGISGFSGDGGPATSASISESFGVAVDAEGNLYIADSRNNRIRKVGPDGTITTVAGNGVATFSGDNGPAASASLNGPSTVAVDPAKNLYIADTFNNRIRKVSPDGMMTTVAGNGLADFSGDNGPAVSASLNFPVGVALDVTGNLYIVDANNLRIRRVSPGGTISTVAGNGSRGFSGDGGPATNASFAGLTASGLAFDASGNLYITDQANNRIRKLSPDGTINTVAGSGAPGPGGFSGDGGPATSALLNGPSGLGVDAAGNLYVADLLNTRLRKVSPDGTISTAAGGGPFKFSGDGGPATSASLDGPHGVAVDPAGNLDIADTFSNRIRRVTRGGMINTVAGTGDVGFSGDGGLATSATLRTPRAVAAGGGGSLYISDSFNNRVRKVSPGGVINTVAGGGGVLGDNGPATSASLNRPSGIAVDAAGNLYITDTNRNRIRKVDQTGIINTVAGNGTPGFSGDGGPATSAALSLSCQGGFPGPGVAVDGAGNLYISDLCNHRIRKVSSAGIISTFAGNGTPGFSGDSGGATAASLNFPSGLAVDGAGNLYFADTANHRVRKVSPNGTISTVAGNGVAGFSGDGGPATSASLNGPQAVALDAAGNLYIIERFNDRVRKVLAAPPVFSVAPGSLSFSAPAGAPVVAPQEIAVLSEVTGLGWSAQATTQSGGAWLTVSPAAGSTPGVLSVSVNAGSLARGTYQGTITITAPLASPATRSVSVQLTVTLAQAPQLAVEPSLLTFQVTPGAGNPPAQVLRVSNAGSGTLNWTAQASTQSGGPWLIVAPSAGSAAAGSPATVQVIANLTGLGTGVYSGSVQVASATTNETKAVSITLLLSQVTQIILVSQSGLSFTGVEGGSLVPSQSIGILNTGQGTMNWTATASTLAGGNWLSATPSSGSSVANSLRVPLVDVSADVSGLRAGQYNGLVRVDAPGANNSPQFVTVVLNVLPAGSNPGVLVRPTGLIFAARAGTSSPGSQTVRLSTARTATVNAVGGLLTASGGNWLDAVPRNLTFSATGARSIVVQPTLAALAAGVYRGALTLIFDDGSPSQVVDILFLVVSAAASPTGRQGAAADGACSPQKLLAVYRSGGNKFAALIAWPSPIEVQVVDDCGNTVPDASVVATFSNGDPPLTLASLQNGTYTGTWRPLTVAAQMTIKVRAELSPLAPAEVQAPPVAVQENPKAALVSSAGVVDAASFSSGAPLAPGSIIAVFGRNLAPSTDSAKSVPLPTSLSGATVSVGNVTLPLFFASNGQINAQLPFELAPNSRPQVVVQTQAEGLGPLLAVPETITVAAARPAIFSTDSTGKGQGAIVIATTGEFAAPAGSLPGRPARPVRSNEIISIFATGLGEVTNRPANGAGALTSPLSETLLKPTVTIGGVPATVGFSGLAPFFVGLYQVNVTVPANAPTGAAISVVLTMGGASSNTVTVAVE